MKVQNKKCIRKLSFKALKAARKRNLIAIFAIALTTLLFTSLFTIVLSLNASYETYQFRQAGGYCHGTFKDVTQEQAERISSHPKVKEAGFRKVIGFCSDGVFSKTSAEVSYMDGNCTKWCYATPTTGRMPQSGKEVAMDTTALELLGVTPELGAEVTVTFTVTDKDQIGGLVTDTFTLVGYWDYDQIMVHYINVSEDYAQQIEDEAVAGGMNAFRIDMPVMMKSSIDIQGQMEQVDTDLGYTWDSYTDENSVRIGVNWGYTTSQIGSIIDFNTVFAIVAFLLLVIFTGYLIIYNIFQISVTEDIRFYGLLKTIGTTPTQLRRIVRQQALMLCVIGIPIGLLFGFGIGGVLTPVVIKSSNLGVASMTISTSPLIFVVSALFAILTVLMSCAKPAKLAARVSPVEATKYTDVANGGRKKRSSRGAKVYQMAFANLGRNKKKTALVVASLALSITLLNCLYGFVDGFDEEKYISEQSCADFIVSSTDYFNYYGVGVEDYLTEEDIDEVKSNTNASLSGVGYAFFEPKYLWMNEDALRMDYSYYYSESEIDSIPAGEEHRGELVRATCQIEGLDNSLFDKLTVIEGDLSPLFDDSHSIAIEVYTDDYGNVSKPEYYPNVGDTVTIDYIDSMNYIDSRTGKLCTEDTPSEYVTEEVVSEHEVDYTVCALVEVPYSMGYRYSTIGYAAILPVETLVNDSGKSAVPMFYLFDTPDDNAEAEAEEYLADLTKGVSSVLGYESKATVREEFMQFKRMFMILGGVLCGVIAMVGILNFFNAIMTGIISRNREFAVLRAVGMTNGQLRSMLIYEGVFYTLCSAGVALVLSVAIVPLVGRVFENVYWFFEYRFTITPVIVAIPVFLALGVAIPMVLYGQANRESVVERLRGE